MPDHHSLLSLKPDDTPDYMNPAWVGCMRWALGDVNVIAAFRAETGNQWEPGKTGMERMVDDVTGAQWHFISDFVKWANVAIWGPMDGEDDADA